MAKITFLGAAGTVTGSKYLVEADGKRLLVDCGLFEGSKDLNAAKLGHASDRSRHDRLGAAHARAHRPYGLSCRAWCATAFAARSTRIPPRTSFAICCFPIPRTCRKKTRDIAAKKNYTSHKPPLPLYTVEESQQALQQFREIPRADPFTISPQFSVRPHDAGHILGSTWLELTITENGKQTLVVFSGDVGRYNQPILKDPESPTRADFLLCESTYGDRDHPAGSVADDLADVINRTAKRGGAVVIPAFAVDRTQLLMYYLR